MTRDLHVISIHRIEYKRCLEWQRNLAAARAAGEIPDLLILTEHEPVITVGRAGAAPAANANVNIVNVERGGMATYHGPGQLIGYPIIYLEENERDVHAYLRKIEDVLIETLVQYNLSAVREPGATGVWLLRNHTKIASIGIAVKRWVTLHGFALNVSSDLHGFDGFDPCGFPSNVMTTMEKELQTPVERRDLERVLIDHFAAVFDRNAVRAGENSILQYASRES
ncbi:MAG: lipoyl(octanoyl) transferase LipB [Planctomycetota bacterium]